MPINDRDQHGRATSAYDTRALYDLVAEVARVASPDDPTNVSQRAWDEARQLAGRPDAPSARCITMRLRAVRDGRAYPWRRLLERVFDPTTNIEQVETRRRTVKWNTDFTNQHLAFALRAVAKRLGVSTVAPSDYQHARDEMLAAARRGRRTGLADTLPTRAQIESTLLRQGLPNEGQAWDRALQLAGLEPRTAAGRKGKRGKTAQTGVMKMPEAIHQYFEAGNSLEFWPSKNRILKFRDAADIRMEVATRPWAEILKEAQALRESLGLPFPTKSRPPGGRQRWESLKLPKERIPGTFPKRRGNSRRPYTDEELLAALERYDREAPASERRTQANYARFAREHKLPSSTLMQRVGGFREAMAKIRERKLRSASKR